MASHGGQRLIYQGFIDWILNTAQASASSPFTRILEAATQSPELVRCLIFDSGWQTGWKEFANRARAFGQFSSAAARAPDEFMKLAPATRDIATALSPYEGLWTTEGLGFHYAASQLKENVQPTSLLNAESGALPQRSLIPLHTGMGLAFAWYELHSVAEGCQYSELASALRRFRRLCNENSIDGYTGAAYEGIGLIARLLRPSMILATDRILRETSPELSTSFWHGVGRGLYFSLSNVLPCTSVLWPAIKKALEEPPNEIARRNAISGLAWAVTLVNIEDPDVIETFVSRYSRELDESDAFANGVMSAVAVWQDWVEDPSVLKQFCSYKPNTSNCKRIERWNRHARAHCNEWPQSMRNQRDDPEGLFQYEPVHRR